MKVSRLKTLFMDFTLRQNVSGNREPMKIIGEELERVTHFKMPRDECRRGMLCGNGDHSANGTRLKTLEEVPGIIVHRRQKRWLQRRNKKMGLNKRDNNARWMYGLTRKIWNKHL